MLSGGSDVTDFLELRYASLVDAAGGGLSLARNIRTSRPPPCRDGA
jgi:hypothetical protein